MLEIKNLKASIDGKIILKNFSITIRAGEIHAIMGPNGAGKSTLAKVIAGHSAYEVNGGEILFNGESVLDKQVAERAHLGMFMSFQYPLEVHGISNFLFLFSIYNAKRKALKEKEITKEEFELQLLAVLDRFQINPKFLSRDLNSGFSGGEKKRNEILQMAVLDPSFAILDETDSGLDIDALKAVAQGINTFMHPDKAIVLITHYQRLLDYIKPDFVHVMKDGEIILSGGKELALELENKGYDWIAPKEEVLC
ncbi:MAG: Fe-S cluster assembly ATPase SufC [Chlamydiales bacterium]|nr:Fe-S cluster assembly ATPase SufC [Chlamydiales bacterium]